MWVIGRSAGRSVGQSTITLAYTSCPDDRQTDLRDNVVGYDLHDAARSGVGFVSETQPVPVGPHHEQKTMPCQQYP